MKNLIIIPILMLLFALNACDRDIEFETISKTNPEYHVITESQKTVDGNPVYSRVSGVTVELYNSQNDQITFSNIVLQKTTESDGRAIIMPAELNQGKYYLALEKADSSAFATSLFLLFNDGQTIQRVLMEKTLLRITPTEPKTATTTQPAVGATAYFYMNKADRDNRNVVNAVAGLTKTLAATETNIDYFKADLGPVYKKIAFISVEKTVAGRLLLGRINPEVAFASKSYPVTIYLFDLYVNVKDKNNNNLPQASVSLFASKLDMDNNINVIATKTTDSNGEVLFTREENGLTEGTKYWVKVSKDTKTTSVETSALQWVKNTVTVQIK